VITSGDVAEIICGRKHG